MTPGTALIRSTGGWALHFSRLSPLKSTLPCCVFLLRAAPCMPILVAFASLAPSAHDTGARLVLSMPPSPAERSQQGGAPCTLPTPADALPPHAPPVRRRS